MSRLRRGIAISVAVALGLVGSSLAPTARDAGTAHAETPPPPNFVYLLADDMRADDLQWLPKTRALLGTAGRTFDHAISPHPLCCPARASILTGQYAQNHGVRHNSGPRGGYTAYRPSESIGTMLQRAGYQTSFHGKHLNGYTAASAASGPDPGWDIWDPMVGGQFNYRNFRFFNGDTYTDDYITTRIAERTTAAIEQFTLDGRPFAVMAHHVAPHTAYGAPWVSPGVRHPDDKHGHPAVPEPRYAASFPTAQSPSLSKPSFNERNMADKPRAFRKRAKVSRAYVQRHFLGRIRSLQSLDDAVVAVVDALTAAGVEDDTYVIVTSDNGYSLGEHRYANKNQIQSEVLAVPLVIAGPGVPPGTRSPAHVTLVDLTTTMLELAGATSLHPQDGLSFAAHLRGGTLPPRDTVLVQTGDATARSWVWRGVHTDRYLYARHRNGQRMLFDLAKDRHSLRGVQDNPRYRNVRRALDDRSRLLRTCAGSACNRVFGALPRPVRAGRLSPRARKQLRAWQRRNR